MTARDRDPAAAGETLASIELLAPLSPAERAALERRCRWRRYGPGEQIIDGETHSTDVYFIASGAVRVLNYSAAGREISFDDIRAGGCFGELAAIDGHPRSANVVAIVETLTACVPAIAFRELVSGHPQVAWALLRRLAAVVRQSTGRIMDLSSLGANNRVYAELLREARAAGIRVNRAVITPIPVHADIAARVSTTRETVARVLNDLARKGVAHREAGALVITDIERLAAMVEEFRAD